MILIITFIHNLVQLSKDADSALLCTSQDTKFQLLSDVSVNISSSCNFSGIIYGDNKILTLRVLLFNNLSNAQFYNLTIVPLLFFANYMSNSVFANCSIIQSDPNIYGFIKFDVKNISIYNSSFQLFSVFCRSIAVLNYYNVSVSTNSQLSVQNSENLSIFSSKVNYFPADIKPLFGLNLVNIFVSNSLLNITENRTQSLAQSQNYSLVSDLIENSTFANTSFLFHSQQEQSTQLSEFEESFITYKLSNCNFVNASFLVQGNAGITSNFTKFSFFAHVFNSTFNRIKIVQNQNVTITAVNRYGSIGFIGDTAWSRFLDVQIYSSSKIFGNEFFSVFAKSVKNSIIIQVSMYINVASDALYVAAIQNCENCSLENIGVFGQLTSVGGINVSLIINSLSNSTLLKSFCAAAILTENHTYFSYIATFAINCENSSISQSLVHSNFSIVRSVYKIYASSFVTTSRTSNFTEIQLHGVNTSVESRSLSFGVLGSFSNLSRYQLISINMLKSQINIQSSNEKETLEIGGIMGSMLLSTLNESLFSVIKLDILLGDLVLKQLYTKVGGFASFVQDTLLQNIFFEILTMNCSDCSLLSTATFITLVSNSTLAQLLLITENSFNFDSFYIIQLDSSSSLKNVFKHCQTNSVDECLTNENIQFDQLITTSKLSSDFWLAWPGVNGDFPFLLNAILLNFGNQPIRFFENSSFLNSNRYFIEEFLNLIVGNFYSYSFMFDNLCTFEHPLKVIDNNLLTTIVGKCYPYETIYSTINYLQQRNCQTSQEVITGVCINSCEHDCLNGFCFNGNCVCNLHFSGQQCQLFNCMQMSPQCFGLGNCIQTDEQNYCKCLSSNQFFDFQNQQCVSKCIDAVNPQQLCLENGIIVCISGYHSSCMSAIECGQTQCSMNGTCFGDYMVPKCKCKSGSFGTNCQYNLTQCNAEMCHDNGICQPDQSCVCSAQGKFQDSFCSVCQDQFFGPGCDLSQEVCSNTVCNNNGICLQDRSCKCNSQFSGLNCLNCVSGFVGILCDIQNSECNQVNCSGKGSCKQDFSCICSVPFAGKRCEGCQSGLIGQNCEIMQKQCDESCKHGTKCNISGNCICGSSFGGKYCQVDVAGATIGSIILIIVVGLSLFAIYWFVVQKKSVNELKKMLFSQKSREQKLKQDTSKMKQPIVNI